MAFKMTSVVSQCSVFILNETQASTWHDECIGVSPNGAVVIQPAQGGWGETDGFTGEGHKIVHHHSHILRVQADNGGRH